MTLDLLASDTGPWMDLTTLQMLAEQAERTKDYAPVIRTLGSVWGNPDALQMSFLKNPSSVKLDNTDSGVDFEQVKKAFQLIKNLVSDFKLPLLIIIRQPIDVQQVFASSVERMLGDLKRYRHNPTIYDLRKYLILLEVRFKAWPISHLSSESYVSRSLVLQEGDCGVIWSVKFPTNGVFQLPPRPLSLSVYHLAFVVLPTERMSNEKWKFFHRQLQDYMSVLVMSLPYQTTQLHTNAGVRQAAVMLGWMYEENNRRIEELDKLHTCGERELDKIILKKKEFYNEVVSENMSIRTDFLNWKKGVGYAIRVNSI